MSRLAPQEYLKAALEHGGYTTPYELLLTVPRRHADYSVESDPQALGQRIGEKVNLRLRVTSEPRVSGKEPRFSLEVEDRSGARHKLTCFGALRWSPWQRVGIGDEVFVQAKVTEFQGRPYLNAPEWVSARHWGRVIPIYASVPGRLSGEKLAQALQCVLEDVHAIEDAQLAIRQAYGGLDETTIRVRLGLKWTLRQVIFGLHAPATSRQFEGAMVAVRRLGVDMLRFAAERTTAREFVHDSVVRLDTETLRHLAARLPFPLTEGEASQSTAVEEIRRMLAEPYPMVALLSADVGVGKTVTYMLPAIAAQRLGKRVAVLIPNGVLVDQVASEFRACFPDTPVLSIANGKRGQAHDLSNNPIVIGTTAIITLLGPKKPHLLVIDESQKTSTEQRTALTAPFTNVLETTATAIPRTLALTLHGRKSLIQVDKRHVVPRLHTHVIDATGKHVMLERLRAVIAAGGQAAIIYPRVRHTSGGFSVLHAAEAWEKHFPGQVAILHGQMSEEDKKGSPQKTEKIVR